jgi:hypothetical protein
MNIPFWKSTRARLILLIVLIIAPAFLVQAYGAWSDLRRDVSARKQAAVQNAARAGKVRHAAEYIAQRFHGIGAAA